LGPALVVFFVRGATGFNREETYFVGGNRHSRRLTRHLPIFEAQCTRTGLLKYSEIDMRVMREGAPKNGVRKWDTLSAASPITNG